MDKSFRQVLLKEMESIPTVDCHSHTRLKKEYYKQGPWDLFHLSAYFQRDIVSTAGEELYKGTKTDEERWELLKGVLARSRNTSYWRHNIVMYQKLFGLEDSELNDNNWQAVNKAIKKKTADPDWYHHVTVKLCNLRTQVKNIPWFERWEPEYFTGILRMEGAIGFHSRESYDHLAAHTETDITDLDDAKHGLQDLTDQYIGKGIRGLKLAHAYGRTLDSRPVKESMARKLFDKFMKEGRLEGQDLKDLQDHMIYFLAELCHVKELVFQIHTGVQTNWGNIPESDPLLLIPLLKAFPGVKFDLFHAGYPYSREIGMLGKHYPNVWLNMAWMYVISPAASRQLLSEWFDLVPGYRILAFGSDVGFPEFIYGHLVMARECLADVLAEKVDSDFLSKEEAIALARKTLYDNAVELYKLDA